MVRLWIYHCLVSTLALAAAINVANAPMHGVKQSLVVGALLYLAALLVYRRYGRKAIPAGRSAATRWRVVAILISVAALTFAGVLSASPIKPLVIVAGLDDCGSILWPHRFGSRKGSASRSTSRRC